MRPHTTSPTEPVVDAPARAGGTLLAGIAGVLSALRRPAKPLHPRGRVADGVLRRTGGDRASGVPWLDSPGEDRVVLRLSRAVGLPAPLPDIFGLALRRTEDEGGDLLLATTGSGTLTRYVLTAHLAGHERTFTSLLPYRSPHGSLWLGARRTEDNAYELAWARRTGAWTVFARLEPGEERADDESLSFDPVAHPLPGLTNHGWVQRLRQPAYRRARRSSGRSA